MLYLLRSVLFYCTCFVASPAPYAFRQGCYGKSGDIVVLCAYLGQLMQIRKALASEVTTVIDERDAQAIMDLEGDVDASFLDDQPRAERIAVSKRV